jgi:hypothetical protein
MDVEVVPSHSSESSSCKDAVQRCVLCCRMTLFFSRHVMKCTITFQKCLKVTSSIRGFPLCQKLYQYASFSIPKDGSHGLSVWGQCFHILFLGRCCAMLFHTLLFCFWIKVMEIAFLACYDAAKKVVVFNSILFQQLQWNKLSGIPTFYHLMKHTVFHSSICCFFPVMCCLSLMSSSIFPSFLLV